MLLRTLGSLALTDSDFRRPKPLLLLAYLALQGPNDRRFLAELIWPNAADPRQSLTVAVSQLHGAVPSAIRTDGSRLVAEVECDAVQLIEAAASQDWARVTELHEAPFLVGVQVDDGNVELEEWLYETRERLALQAQGAAVELARQHLTSGDIRTAARFAERAATLVPDAGGDPTRMAELHAVLVAVNSPRSVALRKEASAIGVDLEEATKPAHPPATATNLRADLTRFIGRQEELRALAELVAGGARLLTITGLGGIGKTRLAMEFARKAAATGRYERVAFVPLEAAESPDQLGPLIAATLDSRDSNALRGGLASLLNGSGPTFLVLDNLEQLSGVAEPLEEMLVRWPNLTVMVTSREPLGLAAESRFQLGGLALSQNPPGQAAAPSGSPVEQGESDALALYLQTARRHDVSYEPTSEERAAAAEICSILAGSPLGIELAGALTRVMPAQELLSELHRSLDVLSSGHAPGPERHASLRALFDSTWSRLGAAERTALAGAAVFRGGFTRQAAAEVLGMDISLLLSLLDRALVWRRGNRFELHPLVQQYALEKLAGFDEAPEWRERHAVFFCAWFDSQRRHYLRAGQLRAFEELALDFPNLQAAWHWAADAGRTDLLEEAIYMTAQFLLVRGRSKELQELLDAAEAAAGEASLLMSRVLRARGLVSAWQDPVGARSPGTRPSDARRARLQG